MKRNKSLSLIAGVLILVLSLTGCAKKAAPTPSKKAGEKTSAEKAKPRLNFGFVPVMNVEEMLKQFQGLSDYLSDELDMEVRLVPSRDYNDLIDKLNSKEIDIGTAGSYVAYKAIKEHGAILLARPEKNGISTYTGLIVVRKDSGITRLEDLKGKSFAYVDQNTSAGYVYPRALLKEKGYDPDSFFGKTIFAGKHDAAFLEVYHKETDGAAAKNVVFWQLAEQNPDFKNQMLILSESGSFPEKTLVARADLDPALIYRVREALLGMHKNPEGQKALTKFGADRFILTKLEDFSEIDQLLKILGQP